MVNENKTLKERLEELFREMGVEFESKDNNLTIWEGKWLASGMRAGYGGFYCEFGFDKDGKLEYYGCGE